MKVTLALSLIALLPFVLAQSSWPTAPRDPLVERQLADKLLVSRSHTTDGSNFAQQHFDMIVIGGGTAGLAVAVRLSEDPSKRVGVIEAGPIALERLDINVPGMFGSTLGSNIDYNYTTEAGQNGVPSFSWPRGKVLGGSSALNFLVWDRASMMEYNAWEELGSKGWNWRNVWKYQKRAENFHTPSAQDQAQLNVRVRPSDYGHSGPVQVSFPRYISESVRRWIPALEALGIRRNDHPLAGNNVGASVQPSDINPTNSTRSYSTAAYYAPASGRKNLSVLTKATVTKVIFAKQSRKGDKLRAVGVQYIASDGKTYTVQVSGEVILSAGSVGSPQLLETSGIGSKKVLDAAGVEQIINLPSVGENLQDHTYTGAAYTLKPGTVTLDTLRNDPAFQQQQQALWKSNKRSIYDAAVPAIGYLSLPQVVGAAESKRLIAEARAYVNSVQTPYNATLKKQLEFYEKGAGVQEVISIDGFFAPGGAPKAGDSYVTFLAAQQHLLSRGHVHIKSADARVYPTIQPNYFTAPLDLELATAGLAYLRKIAATKQYSNFIAGGAAEHVPGASVADLKQYVKTTSASEYHPVGSCSMLPREQGGVVDASLTVYGTQNLRVVDASIIPLHISAHPMATIFGIAEAGAAIIKGNLKSLA